VGRLVDIFAGCGGLSLGFDLCQSAPGFRTILAVDNEPSAVRLFNANFGRLHPKHEAEVGRLADVCWFETASEIRLFYLVHLCRVEGDQELYRKLTNLGVGRLFAALRHEDRKVQKILSDQTDSATFQNELSKVPKQAYALASVRKLFKDIGIKSLSKGSLDLSVIPWSDEYLDSAWMHHEAEAQLGGAIQERFRLYGERLWLQATANIRDGAGKKGRGQHVSNGTRYGALNAFFESEPGRRFGECVVQWRGNRRQIIDTFLDVACADIDRLYFYGYQVEGLLGGPPCKGFSRIGRPVANALREQGAFAWSNGEFGDERNKLVLHYVMFLEALQPRFFVFENVSNFQSALKTPDGVLQADELLQEAIENLSAGKLHYDVASAQLRASKFGVPQSRLRFIMFGVNRDLSQASAGDFFKLPVSPREIGTAEAFFGLPAPQEFAMGGSVSASTACECATVIPPNSDPSLKRYFEWIQRPIGQDASVDGHVYRKMRPDDEAFFGFVGPGIRWMDLEIRRAPTLEALRSIAEGDPDLKGKVDGSLALRLLLEETLARYGLTEQHLLSASYLGNGSGAHGDWLERLDGDSPSKTVVAHIGKDTYGYIHPYSTRPITIREAARLQSFPDSFSFSEAGMVDGYTAIGNAVAPLLANLFAERISELLYGSSAVSGNRKIVSFATAQRRLL
jgi:site-specific DNA-cytosine methylase